NIPGMFDAMRGKVRLLLIARADHPRALPVEKIAELAQEAGLESEVMPNVQAAFERALEASKKDGSITLSAGSMFVTAEAIAAWRAHSP
ncbi:MAG TPA: hypothetical protein VFH29_04340, partial [Anaerolineales bacterium]|nr:hypothetical protein [Anaerolineales bacterium]